MRSRTLQLDVLNVLAASDTRKEAVGRKYVIHHKFWACLVNLIHTLLRDAPCACTCLNLRKSPERRYATHYFHTMHKKLTCIALFTFDSEYTT
jgi:hypothetical protein